MMLPSDMAMLWDREFRKHVEDFAKDEEMFFKEFAKAFQKLEENGVQAFPVMAIGGHGTSFGRKVELVCSRNFHRLVSSLVAIA